MRSTRQGASALEGGDSVSIQQLMETIHALQQTVATSKTDQDRILAEVRVEQAASQNRYQNDLAASHATSEELRRDLQCMGERTTGERNPPVPVRARPMPFSQAIMDTMIPANFIGPKITFIGVEDTEAHITAFHTQMMVSGGSDAMHCKLFMTTFSGTALVWFVSLPNGHITSFD